MKVAENYYSCFHCKKIPLEIQNCNECGVVVCSECQTLIPEYYDGESDEPAKCPSCRSSDCKFVKPCPFTKRMISNLIETHSCDIDFCSNASQSSENKEPQSKNAQSLKLGIFDLHKHITNDCPRSRACFDCKYVFATIEEFHIHLKFAC